jgi:mono/diheme cytochrome c family protein
MEQKVCKRVMATLLALPLAMATALSTSARADDAAQIYAKQCTACHGPTGKGDGPAGKVLKPPPADLAIALKGMSDADIGKVIKEGGGAVGKSKLMPPNAKLTDDQIQGLVQYIKKFSSQ